MADTSRMERAVHAPRLLGGRYEVGDIIGHGGMADVHGGFDTRLSRPVAIKLLRPDLVRDANFRARFRREAQSAASLSHPSVVAIFDSGEDVGVDLTGSATTVAFIVMEMIEGQTLRERLDAGPLPAQEAARITESVLAALAYSHRMGIVHRDIKPANVMLGAGGEVKVMDFGIARAVADTAATMTSTQAVLGTAQYLSPEQAQGMAVDARSDLYSTGCLLFELLTGRPPFVADTPIAIAYQHVGQPAPRPSSLVPGIPPAYDAVVLHALAKERDARYQTATQFRADLAAAREGRAVSSAARAELNVSGFGTVTQRLSAPRPLPPSPRSLPPASARGSQASMRRRRRLALVGLLLVLLLLTLTGKLLWDARARAQLVAVPAVVGQTEEQARTLLGVAGLVAEVRAVSSPSLVKGMVAEQDPPSDTLLDRGSTVHLTVSSGPAEAAVPTVAGQPQDAAVALLSGAGFSHATVVLVDDPSQPKGSVVGTEPAAGQVLSLTTAVTVKVASGNVTVPALVGLDTSVAALRVADRGLRYDDTQRVETLTTQEGKVVSQEPATDALVERGTVVKVRVAVRPPVTVTTTRTVTAAPPPPAPPPTTASPRLPSPARPTATTTPTAPPTTTSAATDR